MADKCPFCGEPAVRTMAGGIVAYRCGTEGPYKTESDDGEYQTGRVCDGHTYRRIIASLEAKVERLRAEIRLTRAAAVRDDERLTRECEEAARAAGGCDGR